jgi:L-ectoine synthase
MIYRTVADLVGTEREASGKGWRSRRFLLAEDGLPFSVHETTVAAGSALRFKYTRNSESVYCISGKAAVELVDQGKTVQVRPGTFYSIGIGEEHILRIEDETKFLCIFEPPLEGQEAAESSV